MTEEEKKTNDEEKTIPRPEGYTIVENEDDFLGVASEHEVHRAFFGLLIPGIK